MNKSLVAKELLALAKKLAALSQGKQNTDAKYKDSFIKSLEHFISSDLKSVTNRAKAISSNVPSEWFDDNEAEDAAASIPYFIENLEEQVQKLINAGKRLQKQN